MDRKAEQIIYYDRNGIKRLTIGAGYLYTRPSNWRSWKYAYNNDLGAVTGITPGNQEYKLEVIFTAKDPSERDRVTDIFIDDITAGEPGTIEIRGWRLKCFIVGGEPTMTGRIESEITYTVIAERETMWTRETLYQFRGSGTNVGAEDLLRDYQLTTGVNTAARGYDYGYSTALQNTTQVDLSGIGNGYILDIYGNVKDPSIYINDTPITVHAEAKTGERIRVISNGDEKAIQLVSITGAVKDIFNARDKEHSPFITLGNTAVINYGAIKFDLTAIERRIIPAWT